jgi:Zn-dependent protease with chaperone function
MSEKVDKYLEEQTPENLDEAVGIALWLVTFITQLGMLLSFGHELASSKHMKKHDKLSKELNNVVKDKVKWDVYEFKENIPNAFCVHGPFIFITTGLLKKLSPRETMAVLIHETSHLKQNDALKTVLAENALLAVLYAVMFVLIGWELFFTVSLIFFIITSASGITEIIFRRLLGRKMELKADTRAAEFGYADELISALEKIENWAKMERAKQKCGNICQVVRNLSDALDEHPPLKERVENLMKKKEFYRNTIKKNFSSMKNFLVSKLKGIAPKKA